MWVSKKLIDDKLTLVKTGSDHNLFSDWSKPILKPVSTKISERKNITTSDYTQDVFISNALLIDGIMGNEAYFS